MAERIAIGPEMTAGELHDALSRIGADLMARALAAISRGLARSPQPEQGVTYAAKIDKAEAKLDFAKACAGRSTISRGDFRRFRAHGSKPISAAGRSA